MNTIIESPILPLAEGAVADARCPAVPADLLREAGDVIEDVDLWMDTRSELLAGKTPRDLLGTEHEPLIRNLLGVIRHGMFT